MVIKKNPTTSIKKLANELIVPVKTVETAIKEDFDPYFNCFDYAIEEERNRMSEEFIKKARKSFRNYSKISEKKLVAILSKFTFVSMFLF